MLVAPPHLVGTGLSSGIPPRRPLDSNVGARQEGSIPNDCHVPSTLRAPNVRPQQLDTLRKVVHLPRVVRSDDLRRAHMAQEREGRVFMFHSSDQTGVTR